jgi:hypothetical protein
MNPEPMNREPPGNWTSSDKQAFAALPESTQDFILRQCRSLETELGKKSERLAAFHREYEPVAKILEPFARRLKELNLTPQAAIERYIDIERRLATGDGVAVINALVDGYKVPPDQPIEALGSKLSDSEPAGGAERAAALRDFEAELEQFKTAQDAAGNPLHPHYADVEPEMAGIALAHSTRGRRIPAPKQLYEMAVWTNPALRSALVSGQHGAADAESKPRTAGRKPASSSNTGQSKRAVTAQSSGRSLRDEILAHAGGA